MPLQRNWILNLHAGAPERTVPSANCPEKPVWYNGGETLEHAEADPGVSSHVADSIIEAGERSPIRGTGLHAVRLIRHLGHPTGLILLVLPEAESPVVLHGLRQIFIHWLFILSEGFLRPQSSLDKNREGGPVFFGIFSALHFPLEMGQHFERMKIKKPPEIIRRRNATV